MRIHLAIGLFTLTLLSECCVFGQSALAKPTGTATCGAGRGEASTRPIQKAVLEPRTQGYTMRLTVLTQGKPEEMLLELNNALVVESGKSLGPQGGSWNLTAYDRAPVKIQSTGAFDISMAVSTRSYCNFSGTLQFAKNAQAKLFPASSTAISSTSNPGSADQTYLDNLKQYSTRDAGIQSIVEQLGNANNIKMAKGVCNVLDDAKVVTVQDLVLSVFQRNFFEIPAPKLTGSDEEKLRAIGGYIAITTVAGVPEYCNQHQRKVGQMFKA